MIPKNNFKTKLKAFTLLELLLVIAIISVLAGIILFSLNPANRLQQANQIKYLANANDLEKAFNSYVVDNGGNLPAAFNLLSYGYYDICRQGQSGSCVSMDELVTNGKLSSIPIDTDKLTSTTTGFKVRYDPVKKEAIVYSNSEYSTRIDSGTTLAEGLVGWWKMDESTWNGTADEVIDSTGFNNHGRSFSGAIPSQARYGNGGLFDGVNDYLSATNSNLNLTNSMTISAWLKNTDTTFTDTYANYAISKGIQGGPHWNDYVLTIIPTQRFSFSIQTNTGGFGATSTNSYDNNFHHIVGTFSSASNELKLYIDGVLDKTITTSGSIKNTNSTFYIGDWNGASTWHFWKGSIDDLKIYNRALDQKEVEILYLWSPPPVAKLKFDETSGIVATDSSSSILNGDLINGPTWTTGKYNNAINFDGSNDYLSISNGSSLFSNKKVVSVSFWVKTNNSNPLKSIINIPTGSGGTFSIENNGSSSPARIYFNNNNPVEIPITTSEWTHITAIFDNGKVKGYKNGGLVNTTTNTLQTINTTTGNLEIGRMNWTAGYTNMILDNLNIYNFALSDEQIIKDMNNSTFN